ncbi:hypothetical protein [Burkholderia vietnamiensis]|uniref:hypothetical protein n=1 Tax=Burkholderia vietnamiensis TaxID=60552 RepID=UPI001CF4CB3F|nr:hypothetical protein [Burkholderia vietnamiensis]MCA8287578.1 hypothetical protein [Burkholderia vietnamiensis]
MTSYTDHLWPGIKEMLEATRQDDVEAIRKWIAGRDPNVFIARVEAIVAMETVDVARIIPLIGSTTVILIMGLAVEAKRWDVMQRAMGAEKDPWRLLTCNEVLMKNDAIDALLAHVGRDVLNARMHHADDVGQERQIVAWEIWIAHDRAIPQERFLTVILPKLHAAGADVMDVRFEEEDAAIALDQWDIGSDYTPGRRALATYRRQVLAAELNAITDAEAQAPAEARARRRL